MQTSMSPLTVSTLLLLAASSLASPLVSHVQHEKRSATSESSWERKSRVQADSIVPLRIGLVQSNLEKGYDHLLSISHPHSSAFGQHLSADEVHELFAPAIESVDAVRHWLVSSGIEADDIIHSDNKGWVALDLPASSVEQLFGTSLHEYEHQASGDLRLGCEEYHLPSHLVEHVDYITPGVKLSAPVKKRAAGSDLDLERLRSSALQTRSPAELTAAQASLPKDLRHCDTNITTQCIRALYGIPANTHADPANAPGFFEQGDFYSQEDLDLFFTTLAPWIPNGTEPKLQLIDGAKDPYPSNSNLVTGEADGDLQVSFGLVYPTIPIVYQVDDQRIATAELEKYNLFNTFLDALDGSYCDYTAYGITGDSWKDPKYPDPAKGGYKGKLQCGVYKPATVISISYGEAEDDIPVRYDKRQCNEWMKMALQGHTILTASGDYGVSGFPGDASKDGCLKGEGQSGKPKVFAPDYLSSCPYITSVGGTMLPIGDSVHDQETAALVYFPNDTTPYSSSGGFSNSFARPSYQSKAVEGYLKGIGDLYPSYVTEFGLSKPVIGEGGGVYNRAGRAFPDVSANSARISLIFNGEEEPGYGTSFASPIWASVVSLINQERSAAGKGPVGFINPTLYANPSAMNDITNGSNPGCGTDGFPAVKGWDPVTGLGTPNFPKLLKLFMSLP